MVAAALLAWAGHFGLSGAVVLALLARLAYQVVERVPTHAKAPGLGPLAWSTYDRRRSGRGRPGLVRWLARRAGRNAARAGRRAPEGAPGSGGWLADPAGHRAANPGARSERYGEPDAR